MKSNTCRVCKEGTLQETTVVRTYHPNNRTVEVQLLESHCDKCQAVSVSGAQHSENLRRLAARKAYYGDQLMGEEYIALRKRYGLTQRQASKIFGKGLIAFSRYENEDSYPDTSTRLLIELAIAQPDILKTLADKAGVEISLWKEREEDRMQAEAKREEDNMQAEAKREKDRMQEEAKRGKTLLNEPQSISSKANMPVKDVWFALLSPGGRSYKYISGNYRHHSSIYRSYSVESLASLIETEWLECTKGWDLLNRTWNAPVEAQRYVFSDASFSPFGDTNAVGDIEIGETAIGGGVA